MAHLTWSGLMGSDLPPIVVLLGGPSAEHDVSLVSGRAIAAEEDLAGVARDDGRAVECALQLALGSHAPLHLAIQLVAMEAPPVAREHDEQVFRGIAGYLGPVVEIANPFGPIRDPFIPLRAISLKRHPNQSAGGSERDHRSRFEGGQ